MIKVFCDYCGNPVMKWNYQIELYPKHYCNRSCSCADRKPRYAGGKIVKTCIICGDTFTVFPKDKEQKYCSARCYGDYLSTKRGYDTPSFKNAEYYQKERKSIEYLDWRNFVYKRDNYTCQKCQNKGGALNAHHIKSYRDHEELRLDVANGVTLCKSCHKEFHRLYGVVRFTNTDFYEFIDFHYQRDDLGSRLEYTK